MSHGTTIQPVFTAIVVAAGKGMRAGGDIPKQFAMYQGKPLLRHSVERLLQQGASEVVVAIPEGCADFATKALGGLGEVRFVIGGATRQSSVRNALELLASAPPQIVLIHDAARPYLSADVTSRLLTALNDYSGAIPALPIVDSLVIASADQTMSKKADRNAMRRVQTPQAFRFDDILGAHRSWANDHGTTDETSAGDDAQVLQKTGKTVILVQGDERLKKITFADDLKPQGTIKGNLMRIGQGFDVHALVKGEELWLCGCKIDHHMGLAGHSDADVALHAVVDAILGALGDGDIGTHFPPSDQQWKGAASPLFLEHAVNLMRKDGYTLGNLDLTIICEAPKIGPHRNIMREKLAALIGCDISQISVKATTTEKLGFTGRGEGIAAQASVIIQKEDHQ